MQCGLWNEFIDEDILDVDNDTCCLSNTNFFSMTVEQHYSYICMYVCMYVAVMYYPILLTFVLNDYTKFLVCLKHLFNFTILYNTVMMCFLNIPAQKTFFASHCLNNVNQLLFANKSRFIGEKLFSGN